ncbi:MAG TPA: hypothetical protein VKT33_03735 [Candidatus Angelobacter sp.]|nr:hypothetical protein [Candidatus Angelobacter sp.]
MTDIKVPAKYEPKNADEFGTFDAAMTKFMSVPYREVQQELKPDAAKKARKKRTKKSASRDTGGRA